MKKCGEKFERYRGNPGDLFFSRRYLYAGGLSSRPGRYSAGIKEGLHKKSEAERISQSAPDSGDTGFSGGRQGSC